MDGRCFVPWEHEFEYLQTNELAALNKYFSHQVENITDLLANSQ